MAVERGVANEAQRKLSSAKVKGRAVKVRMLDALNGFEPGTRVQREQPAPQRRASIELRR